MLPFTKRPGRGGEDGEVFTKDDLDDLAATNEKPAKAASARPAASHDFSDDEVTNFIPSKSISSIVQDARKPATIPPPPASRRASPASVPPPPMSQRPGKFLTQPPRIDDDEDGRTVVRGAPKIVKKSVPPPASVPPSSMSPAAGIKATLESARAAKRANEGALMPPPPAELLEDSTDRMSPDDPRLALANRISQGGHGPVPPPPQSQRPQMMQGGMQSPYTAPMGMTPMGVSELGATMLAGMNPNATGPHQPPPSSHGPMTGPPPPMHLGGYQSAPASIPPPPHSYRPPNSYPQAAPSQSGNMSAVPAHFQVPHGIDPPGTSVTARHKTPGRPASAWAIALVAAGLFVGVGAVAVMQSNDSLMDTTASFVDPSRAGAKDPRAGAAPVAEPTPQPVTTTAVAPTVVVPPAGNGDQPAPPANANPVAPPGAGGVIGASSPPPAAPPAAAPAAPAAPEAKPEAKPAAVAANAPATAPKTTWIAPTPKAPPPAAAPAPAPAPKPAAASKPAVASNDDPPAEKPTKGTKGTKPGKGDATDEETKKALEALQKAQMESAF